jgi:hypothetical protein
MTMNASQQSVDYRLNELARVAADLRAERTLSAPAKGGPNRVRLAVGQVLLDLGAALVAPSARRTMQVR